MQDNVDILTLFEEMPEIAQEIFPGLLFETEYNKGQYTMYAVSEDNKFSLGRKEDVISRIISINSVFLTKRVNVSLVDPIFYVYLFDCKNLDIIKEVFNHPESEEILINDGQYDPFRDIIESKNKILLNFIIEEKHADIYSKCHLIEIRSVFDREDFLYFKKKIENIIGDEGDYFSVYECLSDITQYMSPNKTKRYLKKLEEDLPDLKEDDDYKEAIDYLTLN